MAEKRQRLSEARRIMAAVRQVDGNDVVDEEIAPAHALVVKITDENLMPARLVSEAKDKEIQRLDDFGSFEVILESDVAALEKRLQKKAIRLTGRWVINMSNNAVKARYVTREFKGRDLTHDFFAPTTGTSTARVVDSYALENGLGTFTFDAHNAFLHVPEEDLVIVEAPG
jgi:hypothetical protein